MKYILYAAFAIILVIVIFFGYKLYSDVNKCNEDINLNQEEVCSLSN
jgi:hypothetical protein